MSSFNEEMFIEEVKKMPELYNKGHKHYMNTSRKEKSWQELSTKYKIDAKKKWNSIRDKYVKEKRKVERPSGSAGKEVDLWELFPLLSFLNDFIKPRRMRENIDIEEDSLKATFFSPSTPAGHSKDSDNSTMASFTSTFESDEPTPSCSRTYFGVPSTENVDESECTEDSTFLENTTPRVKRKKKEKVDEEINKAFLKTLSLFSNKLKDVAEDDEDTLFLKSIEKQMRKMSDEEKCKFKMEIVFQADEAVRRSK